MTKKLQIITAGAIAIISGGLSQIANTPPELQTQLPQMFPEHYRGLIGLGLKVVMGFAGAWATWAAHNPAAIQQLTSVDAPQNPEKSVVTPQESLTPKPDTYTGKHP